MGYGYIFASKPLNACNGAAANCTGGQTIPTVPLDDINSAGDGTFCLCPGGLIGAPKFSVVTGNLPSGMHLNPDTGCIEGVPDGRFPQSPSITFKVMDLTTGEEATATCDFLLTGHCDGARKLKNKAF
jgi:hypothetical protein